MVGKRGRPPQPMPLPAFWKRTPSSLTRRSVSTGGWAGRGTRPADRGPCSLRCGGTRRRPSRQPIQPSILILRVGRPERVYAAGKAPRFAERPRGCRRPPERAGAPKGRGGLRPPRAATQRVIRRAALPAVRPLIPLPPPHGSESEGKDRSCTRPRCGSSPPRPAGHPLKGQPCSRQSTGVHRSEKWAGL